ncbi:MAG: hypothetical protein M1823_000666 [Watsoniomyces obsoletus]|nr:MAG: hypothetical protein M1823_000666 [Watsoniomyces obsoletus]
MQFPISPHVYAIDFDKMPYAKEWYADFPPPDRQPTLRSMTSATPFTIHEDEELPPRRERARMCGLRRWVFYTLLVFALLLIVGLVIGLTVGITAGREIPSNGDEPAMPHNPVPIPPSRIDKAEGLSHDPMPGTSIATVAFGEGQSFRLYYQQLNGATRELRYDSPDSRWRNATSIFSGARNHTGLAAFTYLNGTEQNQFVLYVSPENVVKAKRKTPSSEWEESLSLNDRKFSVHAPPENQTDHGSFALAAAYSTAFASGPGARVYYHAPPTDQIPSGWVQELIWDQRSDSWSMGARLPDPAPTSQLAVTINGRFLRLFYSTGSGTLQEHWLDIADPRANYVRGITRQNVLASDHSAITAVTMSSSVLVYFEDPRQGPRELTIMGFPRDRNQWVAINPSTVATTGIQEALSIGAVVGTTADKITEQVHVFLTNHPGAETEGLTHSVIQLVTRNATQPLWPATLELADQNRLPLDGEGGK